ncbi:MAG: adenosylmethionine--8-amino-7-oxononanoate transaminase [Thermogemmata sp.]|nr:adenosylmethionine--8-amino-7-oxononanoate transaminase [Gemmataceae bacterium]
MRDIIIVGTDTEVGKTTFSIIYLNAFSDKYAYWKPLETGDSDTARVRDCIPEACVYTPLRHFAEAVAPLLAARRQGDTIPSVGEILAARPPSKQPLLIETFGGPLSPLTENALQIDLIRAWRSPVILVGSSRIGAIGRILSACESLHGVSVIAVVLLGPPDPFAEEQIHRYTQLPVFSLATPQNDHCDASSLRRISLSQLPVLQAIDQLVERYYDDRSCFAAEIQELDQRYVWHPYTPLLEAVLPAPVVAAEEEYLILADGRRVIDAIASWWTILHGHCHPPLVAALRRAAATLDHTVFAGTTHFYAVELAEGLLRSVPGWNGGRVFFSDNGSTAVEVALKMAVQYWRMQGYSKDIFICFQNSYHGDTFGAMSISRDPIYFGMYDSLLFEVMQIPLEVEALVEAIRCRQDRIAAVVIEPLVQGAGGMRMYPAQTLRDLWEVAREENLLFIVDEVMTACRTGRLWAFDHAGIAPDLICTAKTLTGGMLPLAATLSAPRVVELFQHADRSRMFFHGHSYTANPLACAVAAANWRLLQKGDWLHQAKRIEAYWTAHLPRWRGHPKVKDVRWCGTIGVVELNLPGGYLSEMVPRWRAMALEMGVLLRPLGPVLYCLPPLCIRQESLNRVLDVFQACIDIA